MPNRYVREDAIESDSVNALTWRGEVFFRRLINRVDDFGCYPADPKFLRPKIFPLQLDKISELDVTSLLSECEAVGLLFGYKCPDGKPYLVLNKWEEGRAKNRKYPAPPEEVCERLKTFVYRCKQTQTFPPTPIPTPTLPPIPTPSAIPTDARAQSDAGIPTVKEIADYCSVGVGIPADYCEHYHSTKTIQNGWVKNGLLIQWKLDIPRWWAKDRATWQQRRKQQAGEPEKQSIWSMQKQLEAIAIEIKKIEKRGHEDPVGGIVVKVEDRAAHKLLKRRQSELNAEIAKGGK
jgi:hypothetical protein